MRLGLQRLPAFLPGRVLNVGPPLQVTAWLFSLGRSERVERRESTPPPHSPSQGGKILPRPPSSVGKLRELENLDLDCSETDHEFATAHLPFFSLVDEPYKIDGEAESGHRGVLLKGQDSWSQPTAVLVNLGGLFLPGASRLVEADGLFDCCARVPTAGEEQGGP